MALQKNVVSLNTLAHCGETLIKDSELPLIPQSCKYIFSQSTPINIKLCLCSMSLYHELCHK